MARVAGWKEQYPLEQKASQPDGVTPQEVLETLARLTGDEAIITTDVGQHQMWAAQFYNSVGRGSSSLPGGWARWASALARRLARR